MFGGKMKVRKRRWRKYLPTKVKIVSLGDFPPYTVVLNGKSQEAAKVGKYNMTFQ